jgi:hypothetical protein
VYLRQLPNLVPGNLGQSILARLCAAAIGRLPDSIVPHAYNGTLVPPEGVHFPCDPAIIYALTG